MEEKLFELEAKLVDQEKKINDLEANVKLHQQHEHEHELEAKLVDQEGKINDLEADVKLHQQKLADQERKINILESHRAMQEIANKHLIRAIDDSNQYSRKSNLIIDGLNIKKDTNDRDIRLLVIDVIRKMDIEVLDRDVVRAHRTGRPYYDKSGKLHVPVICRFTSWWPRNEVYFNRKKAIGVYFKADLTAMRQDLLQDITRRVENDEQAHDLIQYVCADRYCNISVRTQDGRSMIVNEMEDFEHLLTYIENTLPPTKHIFRMLDDDERKMLFGIPNVINLNDIDDVETFLGKEANMYIGRKHDGIEASPWQNPYSLKDYDIESALKLYKEHVMNTPQLMDSLDDLRDRNLCCWCSNAYLCHAKVLLDLLK